jgi:peptidyl-Asp metalloendopeptidase
MNQKSSLDEDQRRRQEKVMNTNRFHICSKRAAFVVMLALLIVFSGFVSFAQTKGGPTTPRMSDPSAGSSPLTVFPPARPNYLITKDRVITAGESGSESLFFPSNKVLTQKGDSDRGVIRSRTIEINLNAIDAATDMPPDIPAEKRLDRGRFVRMELFDGQAYAAVLDRFEQLSMTSYNWIGHIPEVVGSEVTFAVVDGIMFGNIRFIDALYQVRYSEEGVQILKEVDLRSFAPEKEPIPVQLPPESATQPKDSASADDGSMIDVLVVYDAAAASAVGGTSAMTALINTAIAESNTGYGNGGVTQRIRLVHAEQVTYNETGFDWETTLDRLRGTSDGYMDNVHTLRDTYGADEVVLLVNDHAFCGLAYMMTSLSNSFKTQSFAVVDQSCATGYYSFAHEMGHNMGAHHDRYVAAEDGLYSYSHGYIAPSHAWRTIMAYGDGCSSCTRINYWSNPDNTYGGVATGVNYLAGNSADNRRTLNNSAFTVANFRASVGGVPAAATLISPSGTISTTTPTYTWNAVSNATYYELYVNDSATSGKIAYWYTASAVGCPSGTGTCSTAPSTALASGAATWWIQTYNSYGYGPWSSGMAFNVSTGGVPGAATLISPSGTISTTMPTYTWYAVSNATYYELYVSDSATSGKIAYWYTASAVGCPSGTGTCSLTPSTALASGAATWWIDTYNSYGYGPWSSGMAFNVSGGVPGAATLISPSGTISTTMPTYTWYAVSNATWYGLWVNDSATSGKIQTWYTASAVGCPSGTGTCSVTPSTTLASGSAMWWIDTYNSSGYGPWSSGMAFYISGGGGVPGAATLISPSGTVTYVTPTYTWNAVSNATSYQLWVTDSATSGKIATWYTASAVGCPSGTGTCSITPTTALSPGSATWWIETYNSYGYGPWSSGMAFSVVVSSGQISFVLSWGADPHDLDSHLLTPSIGGSAYHVYYSNKGSATSPPYATLDHDVTTGYGPETMSIRTLYPGTYHYYVKNFSGSPAITTSGGIVKIYNSAGTLLNTVNVPTSGTGVYWYVADVNGNTGAVSLVNTIQSSEPTDAAFPDLSLSPEFIVPPPSADLSGAGPSPTMQGPPPAAGGRSRETSPNRRISNQ